MRKKNFLLGLTTLAVIVTAGALVTTKTFAQTNIQSSPFVQQLAQRLGLSEEEVQNAVTQTREEVREEHRAQVGEKIQEAVNSGDLTPREVEILEAKREIRDERMEDETRHSRGMSGEMLEELNERGLEVTHEELQELREKAVDLEVAGQGMGQHKGYGRGMNN